MKNKANQLTKSPEGREMQKFFKNLDSILEDAIVVKKVVKLVGEGNNLIRCNTGKISLLKHFFYQLLHFSYILYFKPRTFLIWGSPVGEIAIYLIINYMCL